MIRCHGQSKGQNKIQHAVASPYSKPAWPSISLETEQAIVELLMLILEPLGEYRRKVDQNSKGKVTPRKPKQRSGLQSRRSSPHISKPNILDFLTIGFNSTVRQLEQQSKGSVLQTPISDPQNSSSQPEDLPDRKLAAVFVCSSLPEIMIASLPLLVASTSHSSVANMEKVRLVPLSEKAFDWLASGIQQPRLGVLGLQREAPGTEGLMSLIMEEVPQVKVPWLLESSTPAYLPVNIESSQSKRNL